MILNKKPTKIIIKPVRSGRQLDGNNEPGVTRSRIICCPSPENCWPHFTTRGFNVRSCTFQIQNKGEGVNPQNLEDADKHLPAARKACLLQGQNGVSHS